MTLGIVRVGDALERGGQILAGSKTMFFLGRAVARRGDPAKCTVHGDTYIAEGDSVFTDDTVPVALHLHKCGCGCRIISSLASAGKA
ncbi:PAAR domain-containing protein [Cupriavidus necator]|uniref:PAAR domain-containing protein n=1 Tax=Cupriavidus necator TaxID=106590 RepID=UPI0039C447B3